jgi:hypothetical protein
MCFDGVDRDHFTPVSLFLPIRSMQGGSIIVQEVSRQLLTVRNLRSSRGLSLCNLCWIIWHWFQFFT